MARNVWEYFEEREREIERLSLALDPDFPPPIYQAEAGSNDQRGQLLMRLRFSDRSFLEVSEKIVVKGRHIHREDYGYFLVIDGEEVWARERDPSHDPPEHGHGRNHVRIPADRISFKDAVKEAWRIVGEEEFPEAPE